MVWREKDYVYIPIASWNRDRNTQENGTVFVVSVDLKAAFDDVDREKNSQNQRTVLRKTGRPM